MSLITLGRIVSILSVVAAGLVICEPGLAQSVPPLEHEAGLARLDAFVTVSFEGQVYDPDGAPAEGAVVVSGAGGSAITDARGRFRFEAQVPRGTESVQITAVGRTGSNLLASAQVALSARSAAVDVGSLQLLQGGTCSPSWLPTFGQTQGVSSIVSALTVFDDGSGPALYAGGQFTAAGGAAADYIAKWNGSGWSALGTGMDFWVYALTVFDDGGGPALYVAGSFGTAGGGPANRIAKWDGSSWSALDSGLDGFALALTVFDDGGGPALYAGGNLTAAGGGTANRIAKWNGSSWSALGSGMNGLVCALTVFDDGGGPALYAGGEFTTAGGAAANRIAKWNGSSWSALGSGVGGLGSSVSALTVFDDGGGPALYAGGGFTTAGGGAANCIAKWNGSSWSALGSGLDGCSLAGTVLGDGGRRTLYGEGASTP